MQVRILPGGTGQRHKFEFSDNLGQDECHACDLRQCSALPGLAPDTRLESRIGLERACSAAFSDNGRQAVAATADRCSSQYLQLRGGSVGTARARLSNAPERLDAI